MILTGILKKADHILIEFITGFLIGLLIGIVVSGTDYKTRLDTEILKNQELQIRLNRKKEK